MPETLFIRALQRRERRAPTVYFPRFPFLAEFGEEGADQAQQGGFVGEEAGTR
jgi:hypothetical protein